MNQYQYFMNMGPLTAEVFGFRCFSMVWNSIGHDAFLPGIDGKVRKLYRRSEVFDMCFDHLRFASEGYNRISPQSIKGLQDHFMSLKTETARKRFIKAVLPEQYYGE